MTGPALLEKLLRREDLAGEEIDGLAEALGAGDLAPELFAGLLVAWRAKGETPAEIAALARALRRLARPFPAPSGLFADCCGTGGDGAHTLNVSTASAFLAAGAGLPVAKHGNRAVSSASGSADVCQSLGVPLELPPERARALLDTSGFVFLLAPLYHPATARAVPVRRALGVRTLFNLLGPLTNPASPPVQLVGVYDPALVRPVAEALRHLGVRRALVVHGGGLDELALHAPTRATRLADGTLEDLVLAPEDADLPRRPLAELAGGTPGDNARALLALLEGEGSPAYRDAAVLNAAALLWTAGLEPTLRAARARAEESLRSGRARRILDLQREHARGS